MMATTACLSIAAILLSGCVTMISEEEQSPDVSYRYEGRIIISVIKEWYTSINLNLVSAFNRDWNVTVEVFNRDGKMLTKANMRGRDTTEEDASDSYANMIRRAYRDRLVRLLEETGIQKALATVG